MTDPATPSILAVTPAHFRGETCVCLCGLFHKDAMGICEGRVEGAGYRVEFNSVHQAGRPGAPHCLPCVQVQQRLLDALLSSS